MLELVYNGKKVEEVKIGKESYKRGDRKCFGDWGVVSTIRDNRKIIMKYKKMDLPESSWGFLIEMKMILAIRMLFVRLC